MPDSLKASLLHLLPPIYRLRQGSGESGELILPACLALAQAQAIPHPAAL